MSGGLVQIGGRRSEAVPVEALVAQIVEGLDRCDALVNDAAIDEPQRLLETCHARA